MSKTQPKCIYKHTAVVVLVTMLFCFIFHESKINTTHVFIYKCQIHIHILKCRSLTKFYQCDRKFEHILLHIFLFWSTYLHTMCFYMYILLFECLLVVKDWKSESYRISVRDIRDASFHMSIWSAILGVFWDNRETWGRNRCQL